MYSKKRKSQKTARSTGDKAVDRIISDVYNEINKLSDSVNFAYKSDINTRDGNPGDIRITQDKSFDSDPASNKREFYIEAKTEDGWVRQVMDRTDHSGISREGTVPLSSLKFDAKSAIKQGELSFWKVDSKPVFTPKKAFSQGIEVYINENVKIGKNAAKNLEVTGTLKLATPADGDASAENILVHDTGDGLVKKRSYAQILSDLGIAADEIIDWTTDQGSTNIHANNIVITHNQVTDFDSEVNALAQVKIDALVDSAPGALDTLNELAAALNDDANFATTVTNSLATKLPLAGGTMTGDLIIAADNKIKSDTSGSHNFIEFDDDSGSPENQTLISSITNVVALCDGNNNGTGHFEVLKGGTDSTATELFRIENNGDAVLDGDFKVLSGHVYKISSNDVLSQTTLGSTVVNSSLTSVGTLTSLTVSGDLTVDTDTLKVYSSNNAVSIGSATGSPNMKLEVVAGENDGILINRNATTTGSPVEIGFRHTTSAGDAALGMRSYRTNEDDSYDHELRFFTTAGSGGQAEHLTIKHNGKIGMGTSTPDANLQIHSTSGTSLWLTANGSNPADAASLRFAESENGNNYIQLSYDGSANTLSVDSNNYNDMSVWDRVNNRVIHGAQNRFYRAWPQVKFSDDSGTDYVDSGLTNNTFLTKSSDADIDFQWQNSSAESILYLDSGAKTVTIGEGAQSTYNLKIGANGRMNMPMQGLEFENDHGYFAPLGSMFLPLFINATQTDLLRFQTPQIIQYWDYTSSAWVDDSSNINNFKNLLDGRRATSYALTNTKRKFRFVIARASSWADDQLYYIENTWSSIGTWSTSAAGGGSLTPTMQVERLDGSFDASDDSNNDWTTNPGFTTDWHTTGIWNNFGLGMFYVTDQHNVETYIRITVTFPEYADTSKTIALKNIGAMSSYSSVDTNQLAFKQDFNRNATSFGNVNVTGNLGVGDVTNASSEVHIKKNSANARVRIQTANTNGVAYMRLENDAQNWDLRVDGGNSDKFIIRDETGTTNRFLMDTSGNIVTTGNMSPAGYLQLTGAPSDPGADGTVRLGEETNVLKIYSNYGWIRLGAESTSWAHIRTDRSQFYFDKKIVVDEGIVSSYDEDLILRRDYNDTTYNQITIGDDTLDIKLDNTSRLAIDGNGQVDLTGDLVLRGEKGIFIENLGSPTGTSTSYGGSIIQPATAMYRTATNAHTGFIKIVVPSGTGANPRDMLTFWVDVFDYASGDSFSAYISGYNYEDAGSNEWHNCDAMILGTESHRDFTVRFCHDGSNPCITIGETDTNWNYLQVTVRNVQVGFTSDIDDFKGDWAITVETTLPTYVDETVSGNFPIAKRTIGTADIATTVTLTDQGSDSTCFPIFSTANTGDRNLHTDSSNLTYNSTNGTLTSTTVSATNLIATSKLSVTTNSDAVATFKMTDDNWGYMEWRKNNNDRVAYFGMDSDMDRMLIAANENGTNELEINTTTVDINADVDISGTLDMEENNINNVGEIAVDKIKGDAASNVYTTYSTGGITSEAEGGDTIGFNAQQNNVDFQIDGENTVNLFYVDASTDRVGIGTASPSEVLSVTGNAEVSGNVTAGNLISAGYVDLTSNTNATDYSGDTGTIRTEGGASIARDVYVGGNMGVLGEITSGAVVWERFPFIVSSGVAGRYYYRDVDDGVNSFALWDDYDTDPTGFSYLDVPGQYVVPEDCTLKAMRAVVTNFSSTTDVTLTIYHGTPNLDTTSDTTLAVAGTATTISISTFRVAYAGSATYDVDLDAGDIIVPTVSHANAGASQTMRGNITLKFVTR